jgi:hypothetical protein
MTMAYEDGDDPIFTVYTLTDGIVGDVYDGDDYERALSAYQNALDDERKLSGDPEYVETTVHLVDLATQNVLFEACVTRQAPQ